MRRIAMLSAQMLQWYDGAARRLPWRIPPQSGERADPYRVWLSEIMLQQTTVAAVIPYFETFTARWPDVAALAAADDADVLAAWAGLGYYSRARNLLAAARCVVQQHGGAFPRDAEALRALPGVGPYTAAAIEAIAFGGDAIPLDANIERVMARLFAVETPLPAAKPELTTHARSLWPTRRGGDFAQALMDLGARICTARTPQCGICPIASHCQARAAGVQADLPRKRPKAARPQRHGRVCWIERHHDGQRQILLVRRPPKGMLGGMRALPGPEWTDAPQDKPTQARHLGSVQHVFTHFALELAVDAMPGAGGWADADGEWWPAESIEDAGLPTLYLKAARLARESV